MATKSVCYDVKPYVLFHGGIYSNWARRDFYVQDEKFNCCEQWMMASKAALFEDWQTRREVMKKSNPRDQKKLGRQVKGFKDALWNKHKYDIVLTGVYEKFKQIPEFQAELFATGNRTIAEASPSDGIWGICLHEADPAAHDRATWQGENLLGEALMETRWILRDGGVRGRGGFGPGGGVGVVVESQPNRPLNLCADSEEFPVLGGNSTNSTKTKETDQIIADKNVSPEVESPPDLTKDTNIVDSSKEETNKQETSGGSKKKRNKWKKMDMS